MNNINTVTLSGNLTKRPEIRSTAKSMVANLSIANNVYRKGAGEKNQKVNFIEAVVWGKLAEICCQNLDKGSHVVVSGKLDWQSWEKDGQKRSTVKINADDVEFVGKVPGQPEKAEQQNLAMPGEPVNTELEDTPF